VRVDEVAFVESKDIPSDAPGMVDKRQWQ
jgi:hypothetical protein